MCQSSCLKWTLADVRCGDNIMCAANSAKCSDSAARLAGPEDLESRGAETTNLYMSSLYPVEDELDTPLAAKCLKTAVFLLICRSFRFLVQTSGPFRLGLTRTTMFGSGPDLRMVCVQDGGTFSLRWTKKSVSVSASQRRPQSDWMVGVPLQHWAPVRSASSWTSSSVSSCCFFSFFWHFLLFVTTILNEK